MDLYQMGRRIRSVRRMKDMTQQELAKLTGVSTSFVGHVERGTRTLSVQTLYSICKVLGVSADWAMGLKE